MTEPAPKPIPDFASEPERREWIIQHADYFSLVTPRRGGPRWENLSLETADLRAKSIIEAARGANKSMVLLLYAVYGPHDVWVANYSTELTIKKEAINENAKAPETGEHNSV